MLMYLHLLFHCKVIFPLILLRGLLGMHMQRYPSSESKLITCVTGSVYLVVIDLRSHSPAFLHKKSLILEQLTGKSIHIPESCLTGWLTLADHTALHYYMGDYYARLWPLVLDIMIHYSRLIGQVFLT